MDSFYPKQELPEALHYAISGKLLELEAEIAKLRNGLERVEDTKNLEDAWDIAEAVLAHKEKG